MQRVIVMGSAGAGKSTFARQLSARLGLPIVHLDHHYFEPGWKAGDREVFRARVAQALAGDRWIVDGNFLSYVGDLILPRADQVLWIEQPRWLCLLRVTWRCLDPRGFGRADLPPGCRDSLSGQMLDFIWTFDRRSRPKIEGILASIAPELPVTHLHGDAGVAEFLASALPPGKS